ncbi:MAG: M24 family metallopeptidase, partial [Rickettsiales bacterium]
PTDEQKRRFTQVLKGHIALATAVFPQGTTGKEIDVLARKALWADGQDYAHGTGHGVGAYLGVHEGPAGISKTAEVPFAPGMVLSNEPGFYKEGEYGIRTENLVVVEEKKGLADDGKAYYGFETITLSPIDTRLIDTSLLERSEVEWLNAYHERVRETLSPHLPQAERVWLEAKTEPLQVKQRAGTTGRAV